MEITAGDIKKLKEEGKDDLVEKEYQRNEFKKFKLLVKAWKS